MLTISKIRNKVNDFPKNRPVEELPDEWVILFKIEQVLHEAEVRKGLPLDDSNKSLDVWWKPE